MVRGNERKAKFLDDEDLWMWLKTLVAISQLIVVFSVHE
jgi:hypothetical protein